VITVWLFDADAIRIVGLTDWEGVEAYVEYWKYIKAPNLISQLAYGLHWR